MTGLIGWWPLNEDSGTTAYDLSGNENHGSLNGGVTQGVAGKGGLTSYSFDGTGADDNVNLGSSSVLNPTEGVTLSAWVNLSSFAGSDYSPILFRKSAYGFGVRPDGNMTAYIAGQYNDYNSNIELDQWYHLTVTHKNGITYFYIDGNQVKTISESNLTTSNSNTYIATEDGDTTRQTEGSVSDVRIYDRALSSKEVQELYQWGNGDYARPLNDQNSSSAVSRWAFDGDSTDSWGNNNGTVNGATFVSGGGIREGAYSFDGDDDNISTTLKSQTNPVTISFWAYPEADERGHIFSNYSGTSSDWNIDWGRNADSFRIWEDSGADIIETSASYPKGSWHHVVLRVDNDGYAEFFVNGTRDGAGNGHQGMLDNSNNYQIGNRPNDNNYAFKGKIDDVRIYDKALSPGEVFELYRWGTRGRDMRKLTVNSR